MRITCKKDETGAFCDFNLHPCCRFIAEHGQSILHINIEQVPVLIYARFEGALLRIAYCPFCGRQIKTFTEQPQPALDMDALLADGDDE
jgi:hypothetical protein